MKDTAATTLTALGTAIVTTLLGGWDVALEIMIIVMVIDYITGFFSAFMTKTLKSSTGYEGIMKKGTMFLIVILASQVDRLTNSTGAIFRTCTAFFFIANESLSIFENAQEIGVEFPAFLQNFIRRLKHTNNEPDQVNDFLKVADEDTAPNSDRTVTQDSSHQ